VVAADSEPIKCQEQVVITITVNKSGFSSEKEHFQSKHFNDILVLQAVTRGRCPIVEL
jgi:hypothetical protein